MSKTKGIRAGSKIDSMLENGNTAAHRGKPLDLPTQEESEMNRLKSTAGIRFFNGSAPRTPVIAARPRASRWNLGAPLLAAGASTVCTFLLLGSLLQPMHAQAQTSPIKIGAMFPLTGPIAANGRATRDGVTLAFDEENNQVAGRKIEFVFEDSQGKSDFALTKFKSMVERDRVHLLISEIVSTVTAALAPYVREQKIPWVTMGSLVGLTRDLRSPYTFRMTISSYQYAIVAAEWAKKQGWKKIYYMGWNAAPAREAYDAVKKVFGEENIVEAMFPNVGTPDYAPYLTRLDPTKADGVLVAIWAGDAPRISRQFVEFGLRDKLQFFGVASFTAEEGLADMPPEAEGIRSAYVYCGTLDTPENKRFVDGYRSKFKSTPGPYAFQGYMAAKATIQALKDIRGRAEDRDAFVAALRKVRIKGPMGDVSFDERQGMITDFHVQKVVKKDGRFQNECLERIPQSRDPYAMFP